MPYQADKLVKVFECGSGKWVYIEDTEVRYTSDPNKADQFDYRLLLSANEWFTDFSIYKSTLYAVPAGSNCQPWDCSTISTYLKENSNA